MIESSFDDLLVLQASPAQSIKVIVRRLRRQNKTQSKRRFLAGKLVQVMTNQRNQIRTGIQSKKIESMSVSLLL